jgi:predicted nucleic acid-binding protein
LRRTSFWERAPVSADYRDVESARWIAWVVVAELDARSDTKDDPTPMRKRIDRLPDHVGVPTFDADGADQFGRPAGPLGRRGVTLPPLDLLIASTALVSGSTPVTPSTRDFAPVPGLALVDWLVP